MNRLIIRHGYPFLKHPENNPMYHLDLSRLGFSKGFLFNMAPNGEDFSPNLSITIEATSPSQPAHFEPIWTQYEWYCKVFE